MRRTEQPHVVQGIIVKRASFQHVQCDAAILLQSVVILVVRQIGRLGLRSISALRAMLKIRADVRNMVRTCAFTLGRTVLNVYAWAFMTIASQKIPSRCKSAIGVM